MGQEIKVGDVVQYSDLYTRVIKIENGLVWGYWTYNEDLTRTRDILQRCDINSAALVKPKQPKLKGIAKFLEGVEQ